MAAPLHPRSYRFGTFQLDVQSGELRRSGVKVRLPGQSFQVLLRLLERPGEVVNREELRELLWPSDTFVAFDEGLNAAVKKLRAALGDSADNPRFVETLPRRGYRFLCPVTVETPAAVEVQSAPAPAEGVKHHRPSRWWAGAFLLAAAVLAVAGGFFWLRRPGAGTPIRSLAVLPLKNLSNDPEQEYFSEGLTDELIARLASLEGLRVISHASVMQYQNSRQPLRAIAKELNVDAVVEGSVLRSGGRVRITVQLVEAATDRHLWAQSYEREQHDILTLQNEVTRDIANNIQLTLEPARRRQLEAAQTLDPAAHESYLRGRFYLSKRTVEDMRTAIRYFEEATAREPNYARAYASLADSYALLGSYSLAGQDEFIPKARAAALRALELDDKLAEAHTSLAVIAQNYDWDWQTAEKEYRRAIQLDSNYATAHHWYAEFLSYQGRFEEALAEIEQARQLDPSSLIIAADRGVILLYARQYDAAIEQFRSVQARQANFARTHMVALAYAERGRFSEALADLEEWRRSGSAPPWRLSTQVCVYGRAGQQELARRALRELEALYRHEAMDPGPLIFAYIAVGKRDEAFVWLDRACLVHSTALSTLKVNHLYDPLRDDPRFQKLLQKVGLGPQPR